MKFFILIVCLFSTTSLFATEPGIITSLAFCGENDPNHPNIVQITFSKPFVAGDCNSVFAAVRINDRDLVAALILAYETEKIIAVEINPSDKYFGDRGTIVRITFIKV